MSGAGSSGRVHPFRGWADAAIALIGTVAACPVTNQHYGESMLLA